jgi:hypothetical protein
MAAAGGLFKVTITDNDYDMTVYTTWVSAQSKQQAIIMGAVMAGQEKYRRDSARLNRDIGTEGMTQPQVKLEPTTVDEFYRHECTVEVSDYHSREAAKAAARDAAEAVGS